MAKGEVMVDTKKLGFVTKTVIERLMGHPIREADPTEAYIERVIYNAPATIIYWTDGTKTVVKCQPGDEYDRLTGFLLAVCKKAFGNTGAYNKLIKTFVEEHDADRTA